MKKIYSLLLLVMTSVSFGQTFYSENMGTATGTLSIAANVFENSSPILYSGTADTRSTLVSGTYTGASAGRNVFITNVADVYFQIDGLNTSAYQSADLQLSFGLNTTSITNLLTVEYSTNGTTWTPLTFTASATGWSLVTVAGGQIPSSTTLSLKFRQPNPAFGQFRIDDVKLSSVSSSCTLALGTPTTLCNASTYGLDTYTVTIPYTGGGNATYVITPTSGTVGGDNPSTVAAGNITISGVAEGTNFSATITGGTCNLNTSANAPECKPINTLPYAEPFNYAEASNLSQSQKWSNITAGGDEIIVAGGTMAAYPGLTSTNGFVIYGGAGNDVSTQFTPQTTGTVYYSFILNVGSMALVTDVNGGYFATLGSSSTNFGATLWTKKVDDGTYNLGIEVRTANAANTTWTSASYTTGQTYFVVVGYTFGADASDDSVNLWINPVLNGSTPPAATITDTHTGTDLATVSNFILRQDSTTETPDVQIDELRIATDWAYVTTSALGIRQNDIAGLKVYPNPVSNGTLFIETATNVEKTVTVYDILGKQVLNTTTSDNAINVSNLRGGVYVVKITEEGKTATRKLVVN
ncbi:T9SS type A sorting domain-containing protein [Flavobacterium sp. 102]|uniref:T9SS type A sorting domain-containing protein n=1 Tax=Flavobacterium sp. 102 TaxID=2135623 RepID=UPI000EB32A85|nr:T9SS type A sorting domain-containing protein [Flavobacterium sp. 102]RKS01405.1 putative secreted protein (Por secretion system target) [Flavobacterium sp. 102]